MRACLLSFALVWTVASAMAVPPACQGTCAGSVTLINISPPQCQQPTLCDYRCATTYYVLQTQYTLNILSLVPPSSGCTCATGSGQIGQTAGIPLNFSDGTSVQASVSGSNIIIQSSACTSVYKVTSGSVLNIFGPSTTAAGSLALNSVSPATCNNSQSCFYECARFYTAQQAGSDVVVTSLTPYISQCYCATGSGTVQGNQVSLAFSDGSTATATTQGQSIAINSVVEGVSCSGVYDVIAGTVLGLPATGELVWGQIQVASISPAECNQSSDCDFLCATSFQIIQAGSNAEVLPTYGSPSCTCNQGEGVVSPDGTSADVNFPGGTTAQAVAGTNSISITTSIQGLTCNAVYSITSGMVLGVPASSQFRRRV